MLISYNSTPDLMVLSFSWSFVVGPLRGSIQAATRELARAISRGIIKVRNTETGVEDRAGIGHGRLLTYQKKKETL